jgi:hypothetical protein
MRHAILIYTALIIGGCTSPTYRNTPEGVFSGAIDVRWVKNDYFLFLPNKDDPFTFTRSDGRVIQPGNMYTDGGSVPRFFWGVKGFSPWSYAPVYMIHDWLFVAQHCGYSPDNEFTFEQSSLILAEAMKTVMETDNSTRSYFVFDTVVAAVKTPIAKRLWENGTCDPPILTPDSFGEDPGEFIMTIRFK